MQAQSASKRPDARAAARGEASLEDTLQQAIALLRDDKLEAADAALVAILNHWPGQSDALHFSGVLRHLQGRSDEALALLDEVVARWPQEAGAWNNRGNVLLNLGRIDEAASSYERGITEAGSQPETASALCNLGTIHRRQGRADEAEAAFRRALEVVPDFAEAWYNLSLVLMQSGRIHEGLLANSRAVALWPQHLQGRELVIRALVLLGERDRAAALYREWLAEEPDNAVVQHQLAACLGEGVPERASDAYVQQVFDAFSASFDAKLEALHYRAPQLVADALHAVAGEPRARLDICDAGCGTGLCGPLLKPWARHLAGCDLSVGMLRRAVPRRVYDALHQAELVHYLSTQPSRFDAVVSADTLCYFGDLQAALAAAARALRPGGWLVFTVEALGSGDQAHRLQANGRYAHARLHIEQALASAGLRLVALAAEELRSEAGRPVPGWLVTGQRP